MQAVHAVGAADEAVAVAELEQQRADQRGAAAHFQLGVLLRDAFAQGRRRIDMLRTKAEDELDRPQICVRSARVVRRGLDYAIVGELVNVDADPADLTIRGTLRDRRGAVVASYNAQFAALHKLLPGEETPFRIDFSDPDGEALLAKDARYDPTWTVPTRLREPPEKFELFVKSVVGTKDLLRPLTLENGEVRDGHLRGMLFDHSSRASTIPLLLLASYTRSGELRWVADALVPDGVRPGRTLPIEVPLVPVSEVVEVLPPDRGDFYVNYLPACRATGAPPATFPGGTSFSASAPSAPADGDLRVTVAGYVAETGQSEQQITDWMAAETWFSAEEAVANGFADAIATGGGNSNQGTGWNLAAYSHAPATPPAAAAVPESAPVDNPTIIDATEHLRRRLRVKETESA